MIKLSFMVGSALRKVVVDGRKISMASQETGFVPISFDLNRLTDSAMFNQLSDQQKQILEDIRDLETEEEMAKDIIKDFKKTGWRLVKKEHGLI